MILLRTLPMGLVGGLALASGADAAQVLQPGETYELRLDHSSEQTSSDGGSGSSSGQDTITVRLIAERDGGQELEYGFPEGTKDDQKVAMWQLPARIFVAADGKATLLNPAELAVRRDAFLAALGATSEACGHWIFTWNAFRIECDPQSALDAVDTFALQPPRLEQGALYARPGLIGPRPMDCAAKGKGFVCTVTLAIDPAAARRELAESDVAVGEMTGAPVTFEAALARRSVVQIVGSVTVTFEADGDRRVFRKTTVTRTERREADGVIETSVATSVVTRKKV